VEEIAVAPGPKLYAATTTGGVFVSTDNGSTWSAANGTSPTALPATNTLSIVTDSSGATVYVGTTTAVFTTTDGGASWVSTAFPTNNDPITALAIDSAGTVYAATVTGNVYSTVASPVAWRLLTTLADEVDALAAPSTTTVLAGTAKGTIFVSSDAGATWNTGASAGAFPIHQIAVAGTTAYATSAGGGVFKTTDGGMSWRAVNTGATELNVRGVAVDATTSTTVFAGTDGSGFIKTLTGGE
jgi:photosystem II stability/assembly factor-like uncharacterized protein